MSKVNKYTVNFQDVNGEQVPVQIETVKGVWTKMKMKSMTMAHDLYRHFKNDKNMSGFKIHEPYHNKETGTWLLHIDKFKIH